MKRILTIALVMVLASVAAGGGQLNRIRLTPGEITAKGKVVGAGPPATSGVAGNSHDRTCG